MNASSAFRSHLMQQFTAAARSQARPPLALVGWLAEEDDQARRDEAASINSGAPLPVRRNSKSTDFSRMRKMSSIETASRGLASPISNQTPPFVASATFRKLSSVTTSSIHDNVSFGLEESEHDNNNHGADTEQQQQGNKSIDTLFLNNNDQLGNDPQQQDTNSITPPLDNASSHFQHLLLTRRTCTGFGPTRHERDYWMAALDRAVYCGYSAPNHKRTEPFTFKRMVSPSSKIDTLAEIASQVTLKKKLKSNLIEAQARAAADKKRDSWRAIPAYLVVLCKAQHALYDMSRVTSAYEPLSFAPPATDRELEDYASSCAAVQNVLLSLHSEQIASKWATGPVIQTRAFRDLIEASPNDRVVALIMVGDSVRQADQRPRRGRRDFYGDVLVDL
jgi:nitroreductase